MLDTLQTLATGRQFAALLILFVLFAVVFVAVRLGFRHKREQEDNAAQDNRNRTLFQAGIADRAGDRTAELLDQLRQYYGSQKEASADAIREKMAGENAPLSRTGHAAISPTACPGRTTRSDASKSGLVSQGMPPIRALSAESRSRLARSLSDHKLAIRFSPPQAIKHAYRLVSSLWPCCTTLRKSQFPTPKGASPLPIAAAFSLMSGIASF